MIELTEWFRRTGLPDRPWLMLGKGPTFERRGEFDLRAYNTVALNHVVLAQPVDVAHASDVEVLQACGEAMRANARWVLVPRYPHIRHRPSVRPLEALLPSLPALRDLDDEGRLVWYDAGTSSVRAGSGPVVDVRLFSSEAVLDILGHSGAKVVRTLGVDGGRSYGGSFDRATLLTNGEPSFAGQFLRLAGIAKRHGIDFGPLVETLRVFVGADREAIVPAQVLEHSIHEHASVPVQVVPMVDLPVPTPKHPENRPHTNFTFSRFAIPELAGYRGRAVYMDSDMQVFADMAELASLDMGGAAVMCTRQDEVPEYWRDYPGFHPGRQMSVLLLDCAKLDWKVEDVVRGLDERRYTYRELLSELCVVDPDLIDDSLDPGWNHLEKYQPGVTKNLHYTVVATQPWLRPEQNPLTEVWHAGFRAAVAAGYVRPATVRAQVAEGILEPGLLDLLGDAEPRPPEPPLLEAEVDLLHGRVDQLEAELQRAEAELFWRRLPLRRKVRYKLGASLRR